MDLMKIFGKTKLAGSLRNLALALSCAAGVLFACPAAAEEPADRVQGVVTLESGEPLAGVTVMVEGSHMGVTTDADGRFELKGVKTEPYWPSHSSAWSRQRPPSRARRCTSA